MIAHFVNILVPVNLYPKTDKSIEIAIHIADPRFCTIHLVNIVRPNILAAVLSGGGICQEISGIGLHRFIKELIRMNEVKTMIERSMPDAIVKTHICKSNNIGGALAWYANRLAVQVVVMSKMGSLFGGRVSPENIARKTSCKVLMYEQGLFSVYEKSDPFQGYIQYYREDLAMSPMESYFTEN